jgi:hypothetical protein
MASENGDSETYSFTVDQGVWTVREIKAAVMLAGCFELCALFGDFDLYQEFNNSKWSWRLIPVLRKIERP